MSPDLELLLVSAVAISFLHTVMGPDHYLPFIALSKARGWKLSRTLFWTIVCGCGHVWSSVLLGLGGAALGWSLAKLSWLESVRGGPAGWMLFFFDLLYTAWGLVRARQNRPHKHFDLYEGGSMYLYEHRHGTAVAPQERHQVTPWVTFLVFLLGPCEPMIPLLYFPAAKNSVHGMVVLIGVYTVLTLATMVLMVALGYFGFALLKTEKLERYMHALSGLTLLLCGAGMVLMEW